MSPITSAKNKIVNRFRAAGAGDAPGCLLVEGVKLVADAVAAGLAPVEAAFDPEIAGRRPDVVAACRGVEDRGAVVAACAAGVMERLSFLTTPPGLAAIFERPQHSDEQLLSRARGGSAPLLVIAAGVKEPGNLGALLRVAEAAGVDGVIALRGGADPYREKAVRAAAGSLFRLPVRGGVAVEAALELVRAHGLQLSIAAGEGDVDFDKVDLRGPTALVLGGEAHGVPPALRAAAAATLRIPMAGRVESLNVAVAAGVLLYEARRQRC